MILPILFIYLFIYLKSMSYTKYTYKKENVQNKTGTIKNIYKHINLKKIKNYMRN